MAAEACVTIPRANRTALATPTGLIDLSVVIVSWNTRRVIGACLQSVFKRLGNLTAEVIVIDNGSSDHSAQMIAHEFPRVRLIDNDTNRGFAAANNQGIRIARPPRRRHRRLPGHGGLHGRAAHVLSLPLAAQHVHVGDGAQRGVPAFPGRGPGGLRALAA
jgi:hypothetical protein